MNNDIQATEDEQKLMAKYGITEERKSVYYYQGYKYDKLGDAVRYARERLDRGQDKASNPPD
jgi:hypothetical protein